MWSTEHENNLSIAKPAAAKWSSENEKDLEDIKLSLHEGEILDGKDSKRSIFDRKDDTVDVLANSNKASEYMDNLTLNKSEKKPLEMTKGKKHSMRHFKDELRKTNEEISTRMVEIVRTESDPLGFYIRQGDGITNKTGIFVSRILHGSLVDCSGVLKIGDEIVKVNNVKVKGFSLCDVVKLIQLPKLLILTVRTLNILRHSRPKVTSRHSSPSLLSVVEKDCKKSFKAETKAKHSKADGFNQMTANNSEQKYKQRDEYSDRMNANKPNNSDLSKNTSAMDDLIWLLHAESRDFKVPHYKKEDAKRLARDSNCTTEERIIIDSVYANPRTPTFDKSMSYNSQSQIQTYEKSTNPPLIKVSTITPSTTVDLIFDDQEIQSTTTSQNTTCFHLTASYPDYHAQVNNLDDIIQKEKSQSQQFKVDTLKVTPPEKSRCSGSGSRGSSSDGSPKVRRKLPSVPVEGEVIKNKIVQLKNDCSYPKKYLLIPGKADKPHRKLPTPPASPIISGYKGHSSLNVQGEYKRHRNKCSLIETAEGIDKHRSKTDDNNNDKGQAYATKIEYTDNTNSKTEANSKTQNDNKTAHEKVKPGVPAFRPTPYRRSKSMYSDFFEQQRHSMFLQSYAFGTMKLTSGSSRNAHSTESEDIPSAAEDLSNTVPRKRVVSEVVQRKSVLEKEKGNFKPNTRRSPGIMRRHASSSFLLNKLRTTETVAPQDIMSYPGFLLYPDDYQDEDLSCSHAVSGMMQVRVIKATHLFFTDKKQNRKKIYCAVEVDFERKAFTTAKKATKNPNWDEIFEIEIQHGREMTILCFSSNKEFDKAVGRASFYLKPLVRRGQTHRMILRLKPEGLLHVELEFTELKTLLQRVPSGKQIGVFGFNLSVTSEIERSSIPVIVRKCVDEIEKRGLQSVGLYRISGNARRKQQLRAQFDKNSTTVDISATNFPDINVITGILKDYLRELPEPLITDKMSQDLILGVQDNIQDKSPEIERKFLSKLLSELPDTNRNTLIYILNHLCRVIKDEHNKMDFRSISVCLAPVLQCSPKNISESKDLLNLKMYLKTVEVLLEMWNRLEGPE